MTKRFHVYWLRESGCDFGTELDAEELDPGIRARVMELAGSGDCALDLYLPFLDRRESHRRAEALRGVTLVREGDVIRSVPPTAIAKLRDRAATLVATHPAWTGAPQERHPEHFRAWQAVSLAAQTALRGWIPEIYFQDLARYEDRESASTLLVYAASRPCRGRPRSEFTYDLADAEVFDHALYQIGASLQKVLECVEQCLYDSGRPALSRRYAPRWQQDILRSVLKKPRNLLGLLGDEAAVVNALVGLGSGRKLKAVKPFARSASMALRSMYGEDLRPLAFRLLEEATQALETRARSTASFPRANARVRRYSPPGSTVKSAECRGEGKLAA